MDKAPIGGDFHYLKMPDTQTFQMRRKRTHLLIMVLSLLLARPYTAQPAPLSIEEETILGQEFLAEVRKYFEFVEDDLVIDYIHDLGHYLAQFLDTHPFPFRFYIIKDHTMNAFAGPGGQIFIHSGLIEALDEVDELAAVICHEIGHVSARHISERIDQNKKIGLATMAGVLAGAFIGGKAAGAIMAGSMAAGIQTQLYYTRNDERQADQLGYKYMQASGFNPAGMIAALNKISKGRWDSTESTPAYLQTHPTGPERMANLDAMLSHYAPPPENSAVRHFRDKFPWIQTVLTAKCSRPDKATQLFNNMLKKDPNSTLGHFGLGITLRDSFAYERAIEQFQRALKTAPDSIPILKNLGETYLSTGRDQEAIALFENILEKDPQDKSVMFLLAKSYQDQKNYSRAIALYERLSLMPPVRNEVFYGLGVSYGRIGKLAHTHYYLGIYFRKSGDLENARFHFRKALALSEDDAPLKDKIKKAMNALPDM